MTTEELTQVIGGRVVCRPAGAGSPVEFGFSSDLSSDVLTVSADAVLLITGLSTIQTIRTAIVADISHILFVRNKCVADDMIELAWQHEMTLMECNASMFRASGLLFSRGLKPVY